MMQLFSINNSIQYNKTMKRLTLLFSLFLTTPAFAGEITNKITDSVQLNVQGAAVQSVRLGDQYSVSGTNVKANTFGGVGTAGSYDVNTAGQAFNFSETTRSADTSVTTQSVSGGTIASPNLYGDATTQLGGDKGSLAGTLSGTGVATVTAGGPGSTATAQRSVELSVFK
jgi:hypothetical protein